MYNSFNAICSLLRDKTVITLAKPDQTGWLWRTKDKDDGKLSQKYSNDNPYCRLLHSFRLGLISIELDIKIGPLRILDDEAYMHNFMIGRIIYGHVVKLITQKLSIESVFRSDNLTYIAPWNECPPVNFVFMVIATINLPRERGILACSMLVYQLWKLVESS